jgi:hypothetical protein
MPGGSTAAMRFADVGNSPVETLPAAELTQITKICA